MTRSGEGAAPAGAGGPAGLHPVLGAVSVCYLLVDEAAGTCAVIDTGLFGEHRLILKAMARLGLAPGALTAVLLTHGHLDHAGNLAALVEASGASVYGHRLEQQHVDGTFPYRGINRVCGWLEALGRAVFRYRPGRIDHPFEDGDTLPLWGGLRVVQLPGHSVGHCGFFSERHRALFNGDLFAAWLGKVSLPPAILNAEPWRFDEALRRVAELDPRYIFPNHFGRVDGEEIRARFDRFWARREAARRASEPVH